MHSLHDPNFNIFHMLVVNIMHEFKLGVWKGLLSHLVQILYSIGAPTIQEFNYWYALFSLLALQAHQSSQLLANKPICLNHTSIYSQCC